MFGEEQRAREGSVQYSGGTGEERPSAMNEARAGVVTTDGEPATAPEVASGNGGGINPGTVVKTDTERIGRNDPCWCGSGKKYKKCHGA
jgi:preprotein translocase subunit SecA